jgi:hypothetical protein
MLVMELMGIRRAGTFNRLEFVNPFSIRPESRLLIPEL